MNKQYIITLMLIVSATSVAAKNWTLKECIDHAIKQNISIKQKENAKEQRALQLSTDKNSRLPNLEASVSQNFSFGRGLTSENTYSNTNTSNTSLGLSTGMPLFTGMRIPNAIKLSQLNLEASTADLEKAKNDIRMQVAQAYVQILYDMEIADVAHSQIGIDSMQVIRLQAMANNGKASEAELSQQKATLAQSRLTATQADNNYRLSLLALSQLLELPTPDDFTIERPDVSQLAVGALGITSPDVVYAEALGIKPEIQAEQLRLKGTENSIKIAQSSFYPQLSLSAGLSTNYYTTSGSNYDTFSKQIKNNFGQYIGLSLSVPIFNRFETRNNVRSAKLDRETQTLALDNVKKTLYKEIQQVYYNSIAASSKYESSVQAEQSNNDAFKLMKAKYENGKANITEFNESKNNYLKAESDLVQAKYEYLYQSRLMDFYRGKELNF